MFSLLQAEAAVMAEAAAPVQQEMSYSLISMAAKGGWLMLVLLALSIIAIYIFGQRCYLIAKAASVPADFFPEIKSFLHDGKVKSALNKCDTTGGPVAAMVRKGIECKSRPATDIKVSMESVASVEVAKLEKGLPMLSTIAGGAPMIGFLGTVIGMIQAFFNMSQAGNNIDITLLSGGIYTAMVTTVGGLVVGILAYFGYNFLTSRISELVSRMEAATAQFLDILSSDSEE